MTDLEQFEDFRHRGVGSDKETGDWMHEFSKVLRWWKYCESTKSAAELARSPLAVESA